MPRKKILWLCSWYPGKTEPFNGDFIQRHAVTAALYNDIYVIHVTGDASGKISKTEGEINKSGNLTEHLIYYKRSSSFWGKLVSHYRWLALSRKAIKKYIRENGNPALVHVHVPMKAGILGIWMKKKYKIPYVLTEHWGIYNEVEVFNYSSKTKTFKRFTKAIFSKAAKFISVSRYLAEGVNRLVVKKAYDIIPNTVNTDLFYYKEKDMQVFRFIHVSNMVPLKNAGGILRAFKLLLQKNKKAELILVGDTNAAIRTYAASLEFPDQSIFFRGEVPYQQVANEMQAAHCFILFSNIENSPCVIGETLCCGIPVIVTNVGGIPELVNETNAILVEPKDEEALVAAMQQMMDNYSIYANEKIAEEAQHKFSYPAIGKKIDEVYTALAANS